MVIAIDRLLFSMWPTLSPNTAVVLGFVLKGDPIFIQRNRNQVEKIYLAFNLPMYASQYSCIFKKILLSLDTRFFLCTDRRHLSVKKYLKLAETIKKVA